MVIPGTPTGAVPFVFHPPERKPARKCETRFMVWRRPTVSPCCEPAGDRWTDGKSTI